MTNEQMVESRFLRWHKARRRIAAIQKHLRQGHTVVISTYAKATKYDARHVEMFRAARTGAFVRRGKSWDCIDYSAIRVYG